MHVLDRKWLRTQIELNIGTLGKRGRPSNERVKERAESGCHEKGQQYDYLNYLQQKLYVFCTAMYHYMGLNREEHKVNFVTHLG